MRRAGAHLRPLGFLCLMLGFGLRLDSAWQSVATLLLGAGGLMAVIGLAALGRGAGPHGASVPGDGER